MRAKQIWAIHQGDVAARKASDDGAVVVYHPDANKFELRGVPGPYLARASRAGVVAVPSRSGWRVVPAFPVCRGFGAVA